MVTLKILEGKERKVLMTAQHKNRILIIGDVRRYTARVSYNFDTFSVTGYVKRNVDLDIIMATAKSKSKIMTKMMR